MRQENKTPTLEILSNEQMARCLETVADLLEAQHANPFRVQAYRTAAVTLRNLGEAAAYDGRLAQVPGFGQKRLRGVRESLAGRLHRSQPRPQRPRRSPANQPPVGDLLDVDQEYRQKAQADKLPRLAPRRFNPTGEAWLPILHTQRGQMHYTVLYSNTARAHELDMIHDWVVIYRDDQDGDGQWTVITSQFGLLRGKRIVRGREDECRQYYEVA